MITAKHAGVIWLTVIDVKTEEIMNQILAAVHTKMTRAIIKCHRKWFYNGVAWVLEGDAHVPHSRTTRSSRDE